MNLLNPKTAHKLFESGQMTLAEYVACLTCLRREAAERPKMLRKCIILAHLRAGLTHKQIASLHRVDLWRLQAFIYRYGLNPHAQKNMLTAELAVKVNASAERIHSDIRHGRLKAGRFGRFFTFTPRQVAAAETFYAQRGEQR